MCLNVAGGITGDFKNIYFTSIFLTSNCTMCVFYRSKLKKCLLPKKSGIKYKKKKIDPPPRCSIFTNVLNMNESQTIYLPKINCYAMVLGESCKKLL